MKHCLYKLTSPEGKSYIGVTCNLKRRMKEHRTSSWPLGEALRKFGEENFLLEVEEFETKSEALNKEFELVTFESLPSLYNLTVGGGVKSQLALDNPMKDAEIVNSHPNIWTTGHNPMNNPVSKEKMISNQKKKAVSIDGIKYNGVREAARAVGESRQLVVYRLRSENFPTWFYL